MSHTSAHPVMIELPTGVAVSATCRVATDWPSVRRMVESGVPIPEVAELFKITPAAIHHRNKAEKWLTPSRVEALRKDLAKRQVQNWEQTGITKDVVELKASLWEERSEKAKEKMWDIVSNSLENTGSVPLEKAKDLKDLMEVARTLTGETQAEDNAPKLAVNIGFLRSGNGPRPVSVEAELVD